MQAFCLARPLLVNQVSSSPLPRRRKLLVSRLALQLPRRSLFRYVSTLIAGAILRPLDARALTVSWQKTAGSERVPTIGTTVFSVVPTSVADVNLIPLGIEEAIEDSALCTAVFLGEHHNSLVDHVLEARIIEELQTRRQIIIGVEMVQQRFQPVLDRYIAGEIGELDLYLDTEWETRWVWPYELYLPVFRVCRKHRIPLVALSMDSETLRKLRADGGIANLSFDDFRSHIGNPKVFAEISREPAFKAYINECITPSYAAHYRMGLLRETANFKTFYTARVLRDEAMSTRTVRIIREHPEATVVCLLGSDHVKFEYGVKARVQRQLQALAAPDAVAKEPMGTPEPLKRGATHPYSSRLRTVMLNPGPADAFDARDKSLKLEMAVDGNPIPIADYLWFSSVADAKPRRQVKSRLLPPVERLTFL